MATRTNAKELLIQALNSDFLAEGFAEFLAVALPEFDDTEMSVDDAIKWEGQLSRHLCTIFTLFEGLFPLEIPLRMGQKNATQQALLLASLQASRAVKAYYNTDLEAASEALKEKIEGVTPGEDGQVPIDHALWEEIYYQAGEILQALGADPDAIEDTKDIIQTAQVLTDMIIENFVDITSDTAPEEALMNIKSLARWLAAQLGGE